MQATSKAVLKLWFQYVPVINIVLLNASSMTIPSFLSCATNHPTPNRSCEVPGRPAKPWSGAAPPRSSGWLSYLCFIDPFQVTVPHWLIHFSISVCFVTFSHVFWHPFIATRRTYRGRRSLQLPGKFDLSVGRTIPSFIWHMTTLQLDSSHKPSFMVWRHSDVVLFTQIWDDLGLSENRAPQIQCCTGIMISPFGEYPSSNFH